MSKCGERRVVCTAGCGLCRLEFVLVVGLTLARDAVLRSCVVGTWAVRRGLWLSDSDSRFVCSLVFLAAHVGSCVLPSEAMMAQRHGDSLYAV